MPDSIERSMFYGAKPPIFEKAKILRSKLTGAEKLLWDKLRNKQLAGLRFKSQHPMDIFIADFYCHQLMLVIELDGGVHNTLEQQEYDKGRTAELEAFGIKVIRFTNRQVINDLDNVLDKIRRIAQIRLTELNKEMES
ncbi:Very-short-patch-repair endonuclease [Saccharicrinis carchari]|uniref:Very-short-patch-repair endonuclease n=1 Tax=Saccharicrinis carchari TaxID=1168039 RepID=A0A521AKY6_SACCC|nr:endonuclease domain-containing protein [Saccharicrinis carchari]SMO35468.1 Very-short-patch-repair endonuclease [Saccharicrinis carchari]